MCNSLKSASTWGDAYFCALMCVNPRPLVVVSLGLRLSLPWHCLGEPFVVGYPRSWLQEFLYSPPQDLEDRGLAVQAGSAILAVDAMIGMVAVSLNQAPPPLSIKPAQLCQLSSQPHLVAHDEGRVLGGKGVPTGSDFGTPPKPPTVPKALFLRNSDTASGRHEHMAQPSVRLSPLSLSWSS